MRGPLPAWAVNTSVTADEVLALLPGRVDSRVQFEPPHESQRNMKGNAGSHPSFTIRPDS